MSNLTEHCLDGWDALTKKTSSTLEGVRGLQSFLKHLGENLHKFSTEMQSTCSKYKGKKVEMLEGTVKAAVIAVMSEIEVTLCEPHQSLAKELDNIQKEIGGFLKDSEKSRKRLLTEADKMRKVYESSLASLKKAREAYHKAAKEAAALQSSGKASKASSAEEKARNLDKAYGDQLVATNDKQHAYYTEEQPVLLAQFQQWEEARIEFVKKQLVAFGEKLTQIDIQGSWGKIVESVRSCSEDIDEKADMECYARSIDTGVSVPGDIQYEAAPEGPSIGAPSSISTHGGGGGGGGSSFSASSSSYSSGVAEIHSAVRLVLKHLHTQLLMMLIPVLLQRMMPVEVSCIRPFMTMNHRTMVKWPCIAVKPCVSLRRILVDGGSQLQKMVVKVLCPRPMSSPFK